MVSSSRRYEIVVVGSGHAGVEAALAAARMGCRVLLLTQNLDTVAQMSCNPAIGGLGKGQIVREIDALGGAMGLNADATGIQFRLLNRSKGASVQAPRAQCDKKAYQFRMKAMLERTPNLELRQASVSTLQVESGSIRGVRTDIGVSFEAEAVIVTAGTFLRGLVHVGEQSKPGGRMADAMSGLSASLHELGIDVGRFKTGTPCRINKRSIDFRLCEIQEGEEPAPRFSFLPPEYFDQSELFTLNGPRNGAFHVEQLPCWLTHTTSQTHEIIANNLHRSALYSGRIQGTGPRYCPSIEDKVVKFADKTRHHIFLEPEGRHTEEFYVNGVSTSLPYEVQLAFMQTIPGLSSVEILRPGYAVEYDYFPPVQLRHSLESKIIAGLYFAGQVNGTSGYEEAAAQGLMAGINASRKVQGKSEVILERCQAYIGVMIDDLVSRGADEPYRMFTSRAEDRLSLRHDNADERLTPLGWEMGVVTPDRWREFCGKRDALAIARAISAEARVDGRPLWQMMKQSEFEISKIPPDIAAAAPADIWQLVLTDARCEGYIRRQNEQNQRANRNLTEVLPSGVDYNSVPGLRNEAREKLRRFQPRTFGDANKINGITPADLRLLSIWVERNNSISDST